MADDDDLLGRGAHLLARTEGMREMSTRRRQALEWAGEKTEALHATAASGDGAVRATVDHTGMLTDLELGPDAVRLPHTELAAQITAVARHAAADARNQVRDTYQGLVDEGTIRRLPRDLLPAPEVNQASRPPRETEDAGEKPGSYLADAW
jgi:hypothetical protein